MDTETTHYTPFASAHEEVIAYEAIPTMTLDELADLVDLVLEQEQDVAAESR